MTTWKIDLSCLGGRCLFSTFFDQQNWHAPAATYAYDFGDDWQHVLVNEDLESADDGTTCPRCLAGQGRCPPGDCGGVRGYAEFLQVIADPAHEEHESTLQCAGGSFDLHVFDPAAVKFDDPKAFERRP
jgi:hypothetical protein